MDLTKEEKAFVENRETFARSWPIAGSVALATVFVLAGWLWFSIPLLINPWTVLSRLDSGLIPDPTVTLMATLLPVVMLTCLFVLVVGVVLSFSVFSNERKHIAIIRRLTAGQLDPKEGPAAE